jgi:hypothetical protein
VLLKTQVPWVFMDTPYPLNHSLRVGPIARMLGQELVTHIYRLIVFSLLLFHLIPKEGRRITMI